MLAREADTANCVFGVRMYWKKAMLCHLTRVWIVESSIPAAAAVVGHCTCILLPVT